MCYIFVDINENSSIMVINRIQTLFLILAAAVMVVFFFVPFGYEVTTDQLTGASALNPLRAVDIAGLVVPTAVSIGLLVVAIFLFKKLSVQKLITVLAGVAVGVCIISVIYILVAGMSDTNPDVALSTTWGGGGIMLIAALAAIIAAYRGMSHDQRLLSSADRLR